MMGLNGQVEPFKRLRGGRGAEANLGFWGGMGPRSPGRALSLRCPRFRGAIASGFVAAWEGV